MQWAPNGDLFVSQYNRSTITILRDTIAMVSPTSRRYTQTARAEDADPESVPGRRGGGPPTGVFTARGDTAAAAIPCVSDIQLPPGTIGIQNPMGMAFNRNGYFYIANTDGIVRYKYTLGDMEPQGLPQKNCGFACRRFSWMAKHSLQPGRNEAVRDSGFCVK
jgi:hypothetical protein